MNLPTFLRKSDELTKLLSKEQLTAVIHEIARILPAKNQLSRRKTLNEINYCINQEYSLKDRDIPMDNNATESILRSFCLYKHT